MNETYISFIVTEHNNELLAFLSSIVALFRVAFA
jgi:hypothetical protein